MSLRVALVVIGVICVVASLLTKQRRIASQFRQHDVRVEYRYQYDNWEDVDHYSFNADAELPRIGRFVDPDFVSTIVSISSSNAEHPSEIAELASQLPHLRKIAIQDTHLKDDDLANFIGL